ncbi:MFS transporter [Acinetobacter radioresistens]|uniref:MFS transporter n=1 Tax=Acinetobacter radioresistens TaxID=40216 RepID=UPI000277C270|nr:MFS transporter [Acinetobacter radioresistens]EJO34695.1 transporter, major facilitator family protein [Acinetobacter radioresistens WC-A-157]
MDQIKSVALTDVSAIPQQVHTQADKKVAYATIIGTTIEWYDYFIYAAVAGLVFNQLFFAPAGPVVANLLVFASIGISFLFRPLGAFIAGHYGDKLGRRAMLVITLILMGGATALIGLLPTYATIGIAAPIILIILRILQGISAGGEWGGAVLMAVEHAPENKRGRFGSFPQLGIPFGLLLASLVLVIMTAWVSPGDAFVEWGWRIPFLLSLLLLLIGHWIRRSIGESPVFEEIKQRKSANPHPIKTLFKHHKLSVLLAALLCAGTTALGYMTTGGFIQNYTTNPAGPIALERSTILTLVTLSAIVWAAFTWISASLSDRFGRKKMYILGALLQLGAAFVVFPLVDTATYSGIAIALFLLSMGVGFTHGINAIVYTELFPASIRFSGISITYALGSIIGGAFAPLIAAWLISVSNSTTLVTVYLMMMASFALIAICLLKDRTGMPLGADHEAEQNQSPFIWHK